MICQILHHNHWNKKIQRSHRDRSLVFFTRYPISHRSKGVVEILVLSVYSSYTCTSKIHHILNKKILMKIFIFSTDRWTRQLSMKSNDSSVSWTSTRHDIRPLLCYIAWSLLSLCSVHSFFSIKSEKEKDMSVHNTISWDVINDR